jgi:hypothetical protein
MLLPGTPSSATTPYSLMSRHQRGRARHPVAPAHRLARGVLASCAAGIGSGGILRTAAPQRGARQQNDRPQGTPATRHGLQLRMHRRGHDYPRPSRCIERSNSGGEEVRHRTNPVDRPSAVLRIDFRRAGARPVAGGAPGLRWPLVARKTKSISEPSVINLQRGETRGRMLGLSER